MITHKATQKIHFTLRGQVEERVNISAFKEDCSKALASLQQDKYKNAEKKLLK